MKFFRISILLFFLTFSCNSSIGQQSKQIVRVAVIKDAQRIRLSIRSPFQILALHTNEELYRAKGLWRADVLPTESGVKIGKLDFKIYGVRIQPVRSPAIYLNRRKFRGAIDIIRDSNQKLLAINHLDVEEYVQGVLYHEVAPWWPMETLRAQAIVCRTFALYQAKVNTKKDYDLVSTVYSQVYGGRTSERGRTSKAVRLTRNKVLTYKNKIFPSFYHATCAGHTEDASRLWNISLPCLRGRQCQFCRRSPHFNWKDKVSFVDIEKSLEKAGFNIGSLKEIRILDRDVSGRITELEITTSSGKIKVSANRFRLAVGPNIIKSTNFDLELKESRIPFQLGGRDQVYFQGYGWGHGVGMCQWGAFFMGRKRYNAEQILGYYYPESKVKTIDEIRNAKGEIESF